MRSVHERYPCKWVRFFQTIEAEQTATLCLSAQTADEVAEQRAGLAERLAALHAAGVTVVAIDLDLSEPHPSDEALRAAAKRGFTVSRREGGPAFAEPSGTTEMDLGLGGMVLAAPPAASQPLSLFGAAAYVARMRFGAFLVGFGAVAIALCASLLGVRCGLSGLVLGALAGWLAREGRGGG